MLLTHRAGSQDLVATSNALSLQYLQCKLRSLPGGAIITGGHILFAISGFLRWRHPYTGSPVPVLIAACLLFVQHYMIQINGSS
ncbi:hypothetical protein BDW62DRAFT_192109, partial [Aspergillus aurantiobrunneus]